MGRIIIIIITARPRRPVRNATAWRWRRSADATTHHDLLNETLDQRHHPLRPTDSMGLLCAGSRAARGAGGRDTVVAMVLGRECLRRVQLPAPPLHRFRRVGVAELAH